MTRGGGWHVGVSGATLSQASPNTLGFGREPQNIQGVGSLARIGLIGPVKCSVCRTGCASPISEPPIRDSLINRSRRLASIRSSAACTAGSRQTWSEVRRNRLSARRPTAKSRSGHAPTRPAPSPARGPERRLGAAERSTSNRSARRARDRAGGTTHRRVRWPSRHQGLARRRLPVARVRASRLPIDVYQCPPLVATG